MTTRPTFVFPRRARAGIALAATLAAAPFASGLAQVPEEVGALDRPVIPGAGTGGAAVDAPAQVAGGTTVAPVDEAALQQEVRAEQDALETLPRDELERRAEDGERAAQVVLGTDFAKEAEMLAFAPAAANDALADAARWYSAAAARGFPGAPSLDRAGIRFWPIRAQREARP